MQMSHQGTHWEPPAIKPSLRSPCQAGMQVWHRTKSFPAWVTLVVKTDKSGGYVASESSHSPSMAHDGWDHTWKVKGSLPPLFPTCLSTPQWTERGPKAYPSISETSLVSKRPVARSSGLSFPPKSSSSLAIFTRISLTSSPMYIPLIIFSNLQGDTDQKTNEVPAVHELSNFLVEETHSHVKSQ